MIYTAKYYPLVDGQPKEYSTIVEASNKKEAEAAVRKAFIDQMDKQLHMIKTWNMTVIGTSGPEIEACKEYAREKMVIEII